MTHMQRGDWLNHYSLALEISRQRSGFLNILLWRSVQQFSHDFLLRLLPGSFPTILPVFVPICRFFSTLPTPFS